MPDRVLLTAVLFAGLLTGPAPAQPAGAAAPPRAPADRLDGPPFVTPKAWAVGGGPADADPVGLFVAEMNRRAQALGLKETSYQDPNGLSGKNLSSARDLAVLAAHALRGQPFRDYVGTRRHRSEVTGPGGEKRAV